MDTGNYHDIRAGSQGRIRVSFGPPGDQGRPPGPIRRADPAGVPERSSYRRYTGRQAMVHTVTAMFGPPRWDGEASRRVGPACPGPSTPATSTPTSPQLQQQARGHEESVPQGHSNTPDPDRSENAVTDADARTAEEAEESRFRRCRWPSTPTGALRTGQPKNGSSVGRLRG